ncbi:MAG: PilN domain-containing protein [Methylotetracoccus sp.]
MPHINLLPWRAELRAQQKKDFLTRAVLAMVLTAVLMFAVHLKVDRVIEGQQYRNDFLQSEIRLLDQKIKEIQDLDVKKRRLVARMEVIQELQVSRPEMVHLFDELSRTVPDGVSLVELSQNAKRLVINGVAQSNARVSAYMRNLEASPWLADPMLHVIENKGDKDPKIPRGQQFTVQVEQAVEAASAKPGAKGP